MTQPVVSCRSGENLHAAARLMWDHDCGAIPVVNDDGQLVGIVTDRDICMATYTQGRAPQDISVLDAMARTVFSSRPEERLADAERLMGEQRIRRLPVVDEGNRPVGMVSLNDIARHTAASKGKDNLSRDLVQTLGAICEPRSVAIQAA
jgi:CBS domain-containing protein